MKGYHNILSERNINQCYADISEEFLLARVFRVEGRSKNPCACLDGRGSNGGAISAVSGAYYKDVLAIEHWRSLLLGLSYRTQ